MTSSPSAPELTLTASQSLAVHAVLRRFRGKGSADLLPCLHAIHESTGWMDAALSERVAKSLGVPAVQVHDVIEFYGLFYRSPVGRHIVRVCDDLACFLAGSEEVVRACARRLGVDARGGMTPDGAFSLEVHPCLGHCEQAPFLLIDDSAHGCVQPATVPALLQGER